MNNREADQYSRNIPCDKCGELFTWDEYKTHNRLCEGPILQAVPWWEHGNIAPLPVDSIGENTVASEFDGDGYGGARVEKDNHKPPASDLTTNVLLIVAVLIIIGVVALFVVVAAMA